MCFFCIFKIKVRYIEKKSCLKIIFAFVSSAWSFVVSSLPQWPMTYDFEGFSSQILSITFLSYLNSWECWVPNKGTTGTIFITSLVWCNPWLGIEPRTSRTRSQHSPSRLSRRRCQYHENKHTQNPHTVKPF